MILTADEAKLIITGILALLGLDETRVAVARRRNGSVSVMGLDAEADQALVDNQDSIWEASAKAGSAFILNFDLGLPHLTNHAG